MKLKTVLLTVALCGLAAGAAHAQSDIRFNRIGGAVSYVSPEHIGGTLGLDAFVDLGTIAPNIGLEARLGFWSASEGGFGIETHVRDITIGARGKYYFPTNSTPFRPFAGAGLGFHVINAEVEIAPTPGFPAEEYSDSETRLGLDIGGGAVTSIGPRTDLLGEVWYGIVSDASQFSLRFGLSYKI